LRKQIPPKIDDPQFLETIIESKQGKRRVRLRNIREKVESAYTDYTSNSAFLGNMEPIALGKRQKRDMEHCYSPPTKALSALKTAIKDNHSEVDKALCPYCNVREPCEFDHYLPKSQFQEFAVFSRNLIWTCHQCNHKKKEHFSKSDRYLNTYYDAIPDEQFLFCHIGLPIDEEGVSFYLKKPASITDQQYKDITDHVKKLKLLETYEDRATQRLPNWFKKWEKLSKRYHSIDELRQHLAIDLETEIEVDEEAYGSNHINVVLMKSVIAQLDDILDTFDSH